MALLKFILISVHVFLQFAAGIRGQIPLYKAPGQEATLPCGPAASSDPACSRVIWFYNRNNSAQTEYVGKKGDVRRSLGSDCSLVIRKVTAEDAGRYTCRLGTTANHDVFTFLNVLTISPSPPDADPQTDGEVTLQCSLLRHDDFSNCELRSLRWVDETGVELFGDGVGYKFLRQRNCNSYLRVKRQDEHNRKYTCQFVINNRVEVEADYTPVFTVRKSGRLSVYKAPGQEATLPCGPAASYDPACSRVIWFYNRNNPAQTEYVGKKGDVRRSLGSDCSLVIRKVTAEDAGRYTCRLGTTADHDVFTFLNVLTISPSPPDADPQTDGDVTLQCSLLRHDDFSNCELRSLRWVDETGVELFGDGVGYKFLRQRNCDSYLRVKRQDEHNRKYTCQFVKNNRVEVEADYTPVFTDAAGWSPLSSVALTVRLSALLLMSVATVTVVVAVIRHRRAKAPTEDDTVNNDDVMYENVEADPASSRLQLSTASVCFSSEHQQAVVTVSSPVTD